MNAFRGTISFLLCAAFFGAAGGADDTAFQLKWALHRELRFVRVVRPHPADPNVAWVATATGLHQTLDRGRSFKALRWNAETQGEITTVDVCPPDPRRLIVGTQANGLHLSTNGGTTWRPMGRGRRRPASGHIEDAAFSPADPSWRTVMATHGSEAAGISVTRDLGGSWETLATDRFLRRFIFGGGTIVAAGAMLATGGDRWGIHRSGWDAQRWQQCNRDLRLADPAVTLLRPRRFLFATLDGDLLVSVTDGTGWEPLFHEDEARWAAVAVARGPTNTTETLAVYGPRRRGLLTSEKSFERATTRPQNEGLFIGPFVKSGTRCAPNADGLTWYVVLNDMLWIGRRVVRSVGPTILETRCEPSFQWITSAQHASRGLRFTLLVKVHHPDGPEAVKTVSTDLAVLGIKRPPRHRGKWEPPKLFDDGKHRDGKAGDGLWGAQITVPAATEVKPTYRDVRAHLPGEVGLNLVAIDQANRRDPRVAVLAVYYKPAAVRIWPTGEAGQVPLGVEGPVRVRTESPPPKQNQPAAIVIEATGAGPWRGGWGGRDRPRLDFAGRRTLQLQIKGTVSQDVRVHLLDSHGDVAEPNVSAGVGLLSGRYVKKITGKYQTVRIPVSRLLPGGTFFLRKYGAGVALSAGADGKPGRYWLADVQLLP